MPIIENLRNKPRHKKIQVIWIAVAIMVVILLILWAATWHFRKEVPRDTTLFDTIGRGVNDLKDSYNKSSK
jgi:flagellar basal body-associated protein FliL